MSGWLIGGYRAASAADVLLMVYRCVHWNWKRSYIDDGAGGDEDDDDEVNKSKTDEQW